MQPQKTSNLVFILIVLVLLGAYSIAASWWFGVVLVAAATTFCLQWQIAQLQQRVQLLETHWVQQLQRQSNRFNQLQQSQAQQNQSQQVDIALWVLPLLLAAVFCLAVFWQHRLGMLLSAAAWLGYFVWALLELQQRLAQLEQQLLVDDTVFATSDSPSEHQQQPNAIVTNNSDASTAAVSHLATSNMPAWMQQTDHTVTGSESASSIHASSVSDMPRQVPSSIDAAADNSTNNSTNKTAPDWLQTAQHWLLQGNPILRVAVLLLLVGVVLLLRFATENWQLSLAAKLSMIAAFGAFATAAAYRLRCFNPMVAVAVQGVGLAVVFLTLIFAHQNQVMFNLLLSAVLMALLLAITTVLSLRQSSLYLAILALGMAYIAPLLIPQSHPDTLLIFTYYLLVNVAVAVLNHVKGWKILNHIAFVASMLLAGAMIVDTEPKAQYLWLDVLLWLHMALFIYVSIRYSQLMLQQQQLRKLDNAALLDVGLIFAVPIVGFSLHAFLMQDDVWGLTLGALVLASVYAGLVCWIRRRHAELALLSTSFLILTMVFVALIFPLAQGAHWSSIGWVVQGSALVVWGSAQRSRLSRYMGVGLLLLSSITLLIQLWSEHAFPQLSTAIYASAMFIAAGALLKYDTTAQRYFSASLFSALFLSLALYAGAWVSVEVLHFQQMGLSGYVSAATFLLGTFTLWMRYRAKLNWQHSHIALITLFILLHWSAWLNADVLRLAVWSTSAVQYGFLMAGLLLTALLFFVQRMLPIGAVTQPLCSALTLLTLASIGVALLPNWGVISMAIVPVAYAAWHWRNWQRDAMLQQPSVWVLAWLWLLFGNLYLHNSTPWYGLPIVNPNDALNLLVLAGLMRFTFAAPRSCNRDTQLLFKISSLVMALLVLSFVLIRALHVYLGIPLQAAALWHSGVLQLSLTVLWMLLALLLCSYASRRQNREFWFVGAALLGLVVAKLLLLDLAQTGTITRVISFMAAGGFMLVIAYVAPLPPEKTQQAPQ